MQECELTGETTGSAASSRAFWFVLAATTLMRIIACVRLGTCYDETYYHFWSCFPQLSYFDHPPLVAWAMTLIGMVFGESIWTIRFWPLVVGVLFPLIGRDLGRRVYDRSVGNRAGIFLALAPVFVGNALFMTPDTLFVLAWAASALCAWLALEDSRKFSPWWVAVGVCAGIGALSKYNMILFYGGLGLLWLFAPLLRRKLFFGCMAAGAISLLIFSPVIIWNARHDWISFAFQLHHGFESRPTFLRGEAIYLGSLLVIVTPVLGVAAFWSALRRRPGEPQQRRLLPALFWMVVLFFGWSAMKATVQGNWPMTAFFTGTILAARDWPKMNAAWRRLGWGLLIAFNVAAFLYILLPAQYPLIVFGRQLDPTRTEEFFTSAELGADVRKMKEETGADFICPARHTMYGEISLYAPKLRNELLLLGDNDKRFPWIDDRKWAGKTALIVSNKPVKPQKLPWFASVEILNDTEIHYKKNLVRHIYFALGHDYNPAAEPPQ